MTLIVGEGMAIARSSIMLQVDNSIWENTLAIAVRVLLVASSTPFPFMACSRSSG